MLRNTFLHLPGVGAKTERSLWERGIGDWDALMASLEDAASGSERLPSGFKRRAPQLIRELGESADALNRHDAGYFAARLPSSARWRLLGEFEDSAVYLDIETTGLSRYYHEITVVGMYTSDGYVGAVRDVQLDSVLDRLRAAPLVVTFNGATFDLPFLSHKIREFPLPPVHVDLRYALRRIGLTGGLKKIEEALGFQRSASAGLNGRDAVHLWYRYLQGDSASLRTLLEYNVEDTSVLVSLARHVHDELAADLPLETADLQNDHKQISVRKRRDRRAVRNLHAAAAEVPLPKPTVSLAALVKETRLTMPKVVGIDLTGSEARPSGWALLEGLEIETARIGTDDELIEQTVAARPDIVSIDSPLSLPPGTVVDADGRLVSYERIHRDSELELRRRGISVYWCLLPSMQGLTLRGMRLAQRLRERGLVVIESFPGAAQDILQLPRKGKGVEQLRHALARLGLEGDFVTDSVSHDELDAITSAVVGLFDIAGQYEALGNEHDDLVIPLKG